MAWGTFTFEPSTKGRLMDTGKKKQTGSFYTPNAAVRSLIRWVVRSPKDRLLDPSCGDGRFLALHECSTGVELDHSAAVAARAQARKATVHEREFFQWAATTAERFDCVAGNPPFIRYQRFSGDVRARALRLCSRLGAHFSSLTSSWAPFLVAATGLLRPGGRLAFVVPAEIGHAPYAVPLLEYLVRHFASVQVIAIREKIFPELSEDCWLLSADGYGEQSDFIKFSAIDRLETIMERPPQQGRTIGMVEWSYWNKRLRPFVLDSAIRAVYRSVADKPSARRLKNIAKVGIGYVTGDNEFFHLRPSTASTFNIPERYLWPTVRNGRFLRNSAITAEDVDCWRERDEAAFLLRIKRSDPITQPIARYLSTPSGRRARSGYKCRNRDPWFVVPDVNIPDAFLAYMSGKGPGLVLNEARCTCTNSLHAVVMKNGFSAAQLQKEWRRPLTQLSCELEGHPLGGGMLKLEPGEAANVLLTDGPCRSKEMQLITDAVETMRQWRHYV
jgi:adenine-specific DNA methylase